MVNPKTDKNREAWLTELGQMVQPLFKKFALKPYRVTCGWPCKGGLGSRSRVVGECHALESSKGGHHEIFISPTLDQPLDVAGTLCHETAHVAAGIAAQHKGMFLIVCRDVGLTKGKPKSVMPGDYLNGLLEGMISKLGPYPHAALLPVGKLTVKPPSTTSLECVECGCKVTISFKWIEESGLPTCGCGGEMTASM